MKKESFGQEGFTGDFKCEIIFLNNNYYTNWNKRFKYFNSLTRNWSNYVILILSDYIICIYIQYIYIYNICPMPLLRIIFSRMGYITRGRIKGTFSSVIQCTIFRVSMHWVTWSFCVKYVKSFCIACTLFLRTSQVNAGIRGEFLGEVQVCSADFVIATHSTRKYGSWTHSTQYRRNYSKCAMYNSNIQ